MAEEVKTILTVDVGDGITSIKEYKKHIEALRGSLLALDSSSTEYKEIAKEIKAAQEKLNEVMRVGKNGTDVAADSYYALNEKLIKLKKA